MADDQAMLIPDQRVRRKDFRENLLELLTIWFRDTVVKIGATVSHGRLFHVHDQELGATVASQRRSHFEARLPGSREICRKEDLGGIHGWLLCESLASDSPAETHSQPQCRKIPGNVVIGVPASFGREIVIFIERQRGGPRWFACSFAHLEQGPHTFAHRTERDSVGNDDRSPLNWIGIAFA
jgi:hypothetical protein